LGAWKTCFYREAQVDISEKVANKIPSQGAIVECGYDPLKQQWYVALVREDKETGNGFNVVTNTLENIIENVTLDDVEAQVTQTQHEKKSKEQEQKLLKTMQESNLLAHFCVATKKDQNELWLQTATRVFLDKQSSEPRLIWLNYYPLHQCLGPNNETDANLVRICQQRIQSLSAQQQKNGQQRQHYDKVLFVRCIFIPSLGKWKILYFDGSRDQSTATHLLLVLEKMTTFTHQLRQEKNGKRKLGNGTQIPPQKKQKVNNAPTSFE
jgi:hypothetical protein